LKPSSDTVAVPTEGFAFLNVDLPKAEVEDCSSTCVSPNVDVTYPPPKAEAELTELIASEKYFER
jgi:hypothetical protein